MSQSRKRSDASRSMELSETNGMSDGSDDDTSNEEEIIRIACKCAKYVVSSCASEKAINRFDMIKAVHPDHGRNVMRILHAMTAMLKSVFGLQVVETERPMKRFILINLLGQSDRFLGANDQLKRESGLLVPILTMIFMKGGGLKERDLWNSLRQRGSKFDYFDDDELGDIKNLVQNVFVSQCYLTRSVSASTTSEEDTKEYLYRWGIRAEKTIDKRVIIQHASEVLDKPFNEWTQLTRLQAKEKSNAG